MSDESAVINEFFIPRDNPCMGCFSCMKNGEETCPHYESVSKIVEAMVRSDVIIVDRPTYWAEMTGQLKCLFDHFGYMHLAHRPNLAMFKKVAIVVTIAFGEGARNVLMATTNQMYFLGIPRVIKYGKIVKANGYDMVSDEVKKTIAEESKMIVKQVLKALQNPKPTLKSHLMFIDMRMLQKKKQEDYNYWAKNGLLKGSPWQK